jgi:hypothetical protein
LKRKYDETQSTKINASHDRYWQLDVLFDSFCFTGYGKIQRKKGSAGGCHRI